MADTRRILAAAADSRPVVAAVRRAERLASRPGGVIVLMFHRILGSPDEVAAPGLASGSREAFERHVRDLGRDFDLISTLDLVDARLTGRRLPARPLVLTFDDGYADFAEHAWPILRRHGVPCTLFVPTGYPDEDRAFWWDRVHGAILASGIPTADLPGIGTVRLGTPAQRQGLSRRLIRHLKELDHGDLLAATELVVQRLQVEPATPRVLSWDDLSGLARDGLTVAPHSVEHPLLTRIGLAAVRREIEESRRTLAERLGSVAPVFAYPSGAHDDAVVAIAEDLGVRCAFTTIAGLNGPGAIDWLRLRRFNVGHRSTPGAIRGRLLVHRLLARARAASNGRRVA